jgi:hypothetical protein
MMQKLPTWTEIADHAIDELTRCRNAASEAASWLRSDWSPVGTALTDGASDARINVLKRITQIKDLVDECKDDLYRCRKDETE